MNLWSLNIGASAEDRHERRSSCALVDNYDWVPVYRGCRVRGETEPGGADGEPKPDKGPKQEEPAPTGVLDSRVMSQSRVLAIRTGGRLLDVAYGLLAGKGGGDKGGGSSGGGGNAGGEKFGGNSGDHGNSGGNGNSADKATGPKEKPAIKGCQGLKHGQGAKVGLYKKCAALLGIKTGLEANLLSVIDNLVNGEYYLPPPDPGRLPRREGVRTPRTPWAAASARPHATHTRECTPPGTTSKAPTGTRPGSGTGTATWRR